MRDDADLRSVSVNFGPVSSWTRDSDPGDPPGWAILVVHNVQVHLSYNNGLDVITATDPNEFKLKPTISGPDTTWEIVGWQEVHDFP
jgi:hypothetical protein